MSPQEQFTGIAGTVAERERRRSPRFPVQLGVHIRDANGTMKLNVTSAWTLDLSTSGVQLEWPLCEECPPRWAHPGPPAYSDDLNAIDPLCRLKAFDSRLCGSRELSFCFEFPEDRTVRARGKVAYVRIDPHAPVDQVGIEFTSIEGNGREVIADVLRGVKKVLVIDNASGLVDRLALRVSSAGHTAICAANCEEAAGMIVADTPDLFIAGVGMPDMEGPYIINKLSEAAPAVPVILVAPEGAQRPENHLDCFAMLREPHAPVEFETAIDRALGLDNDESGDYIQA